MNTNLAFILGQLTKDHKAKVFDWNKAVKYIKNKFNEDGIIHLKVDAGLIEDWAWTVDCIFEDDELQYSATGFFMSTWATPTMIVDYDVWNEDTMSCVSHKQEVVPCWCYEDETPGWGPYTRWPQEVLENESF